MSNETEELQRLQMEAAKTMGWTDFGLSPYHGRVVANRSEDTPSERYTDLYLLGISADANRELLEWLGANSDFMQHKWFQAELDKTYDERACKEAVAYLLASPLDVLRAFVAATTEGGENG